MWCTVENVSTLISVIRVERVVMEAREKLERKAKIHWRKVQNISRAHAYGVVLSEGVFLGAGGI